MEDDMSNNYNGMEIDTMNPSYSHEKGLSQFKGEKDYAESWSSQDSKYMNGRMSGYNSDTDGRESKPSSKATTSKQRTGFVNNASSNGFSLRSSGSNSYFRRK